LVGQTGLPGERGEQGPQGSDGPMVKLNFFYFCKFQNCHKLS
jgi:hypothetical protein